MQRAELVSQEEDLEFLRLCAASCTRRTVKEDGEEVRQYAVDHETGCSFSAR